MRLFYSIGFVAFMAALLVGCSPRSSAPIANNQSSAQIAAVDSPITPVSDGTHPAHVLPAGHGTVVYILRRYCGGARPSEEVLNSFRLPVPSSNGTYYILKAQGECPRQITRIGRDQLPPRPADAIQVQTDAFGNLLLPSPLSPGKYCLVNDLSRSCETAYETEYAGSYPACFTVAPGGLMPDSLTIRLTCGSIPRP